MDIAKGLGGKFFINHLQFQQGGMLMRGKIIGPVGTELSPYYLCDLYPANDNEIGITSQTLLSLDQLTGVYFYPDKATQDVAWDEIQRARRAWIARKQKEEAQEPKVMFGQMPPEMVEALGIKLEELEEGKPPPKPRLCRIRKPRKPE